MKAGHGTTYGEHTGCEAPRAHERRRVPPMHVSLDTSDERARWALALNCSESDLVQAAGQVGLSRMALQRYLKERRTPSLNHAPATPDHP